MRKRVFILLGAFLLASATSAEAGPMKTWRKYIHSIGKRDDLDVLSCYSKRIRNKLVNNEARLASHMFEKFDLMFKDYKYKVIKKKTQGKNANFVIKFESRATRMDTFEAAVDFLLEDGRWLIDKPPAKPEPPAMFDLGGLSNTTLITIGAGVLVALFVVKKLLTNG